MRNDLRIVQAEFYYHQCVEIGGVLADVLGRMQEGAPVKRVVRFCGSLAIAKHIQTEIEVEKKVRRLIQELPSRSQISRLLNYFTDRQLASKKVALRQRRLCMVKNEILQLLRNKQDVVIEEDEYRLRYVQDNERHELAEAIEVATDVWLFQYSSTTLTSDTINGMVAVM